MARRSFFKSEKRDDRERDEIQKKDTKETTVLNTNKVEIKPKEELGKIEIEEESTEKRAEKTETHKLPESVPTPVQPATPAPVVVPPPAPIPPTTPAVKKQITQKMSFSGFMTFDENYGKIRHLINNGWKIKSEHKTTTDHTITLVKEV